MAGQKVSRLDLAVLLRIYYRGARAEARRPVRRLFQEARQEALEA